MRQIEQEFIDKGIVRFGYMHYIYYGPTSELAAQASECAGDQGAFWPYHDRLYASQQGADGTALSKERMQLFAQDLKLDTAAFNKCLDAGKYAYEVKMETAGLGSLGVHSGPFFVINGRPLQGSLGFSVYRHLIEQALKAQG